MNDNEIKPLYIPESSGNTLPNLNKHPAHNEAPVPLNRPRSVPAYAMSAEPMKYLLPGGAELRDIIRRRVEAASQSAEALWSGLERSYQIRNGYRETVLGEIAAMISNGDLEQRDGELHVADPKPTVNEVPAEMWTMTHTRRVLSVLSDTPQTREALARQTGLAPRQVSKAMYLLIQEGKAEVVGDVPRTWRRVKMDADDVCKAVLKRLGDKARPEAMIVSDIVAVSDWPVDEARMLLEDMLACGYVVKHDDGRIGKPKPETAVLSESQTRDVVLERVASACGEDIVIRDVMRLSGWKRDTVAALLETMLRDGELTRLDDERIGLPEEVRSEEPPTYEIGDDDDGEISEPGVGRPDTSAYVMDSATIDFVRRDSVGHVADECSVTIDADGLSFGGGDVMPFEAIDAVMPTLKRVHRAVFGGDDD